MDNQNAWSPTKAWTARSLNWDAKSNSSDGNRSIMSIFPDRQKMKAILRADRTRPELSKTRKFRKTGFAQWMARHHRFEQVTLLMISLNAIWIAVDTDWNKADVLLDARPEFQVAEHMFTSFFLYEWTIRFLALAKKRYALRDGWFMFDSLLVSTMVLETWVMSIIVLSTSSSGTADMGNASLLRIARLLRLTRMARMARLVQAMPELLILIKGIVASIRSVVLTLGLLLVIIYVFAIAFTQMCAGSECEVLFPEVLTAMHTLFLNGALMDNLALLTTPLEQQHVGLLLLFYTYVLLSALTLMSMLVGVICEVVSAVAATERECLTLDHVNEKIRELVSKINDVNLDGDNKISKEEFMKLLKEKDARRILSEVGVDIMSLVDLTDTIFDMDREDSGATKGPDGLKSVSQCLNRHLEIDFDTFMQILLNLRGTNQASFKDIAELRRFMKGQFAQLDHKVRELETAQRRSVRPPMPGWGATQGRRRQSPSVSPANVVPRHRIQGRSPSPSSISAAESQVTSYCDATHEELLEEAIQEFQRRVAESLDNLLTVYQCKLAACEAQVVHGQQQQQQQQQQDQRRSMLKPQGNGRSGGDDIQRHQELGETPPGLEGAQVTRIPGICNAKDEVSPASLSEERGRTCRISRKLSDEQPVDRHALEYQSLPGIYRS